MEQHNFTPEQSELILNSIQKIFNVHGSALMFFNRLEETRQQLINKSLKECAGQYSLNMSAQEYNDMQASFSDLQQLCTSMDRAKYMHQID